MALQRETENNLSTLSEDDYRRVIPSFIMPPPPAINNPFERKKPTYGKTLFEGSEHEEEQELVQVYLRIKPCKLPNTLYEVRDNHSLITYVDTISVGHGRRTQNNVSKMYTFSHIFGEEAKQKEIFDHIVKDNLRKLADGQSYTLLTYGASGSGKTYTLMGTESAPGLVPRSLEYVFKVVEAEQQPLFKPCDGAAEQLSSVQQSYEMKWVNKLRNVSLAPQRDKYHRMSVRLSTDFAASTWDLSNKTRYYVWVSFVEIYNEAVYDLLMPTDRSASSKLRIREDSSGQVYVQGVTQAFVRSGAEAYDVMAAGKHNLQVAATGVHAHSSRSHCIFTITLLANTPEGVRTACVRLCDLAGSERARRTGNTGARMQESRAINASLHVLERCLHALRRRQRARADCQLVPYRESKLTRLLGSGLSGTRGEPVTMLVTVNPSPNYVHETKHVLQLASVAKDIQINSTVSETLSELSSSYDRTINSSADMMALRADNERLQFELVQMMASYKELEASIEEQQEKAMKTTQELVDEVRDITKEYYTTEMQAIEERYKTEIEELSEELEVARQSCRSIEIQQQSKDDQLLKIIYHIEGSTPRSQGLPEATFIVQHSELKQSKQYLETSTITKYVKKLKACLENRGEVSKDENLIEHDSDLQCKNSISPVAIISQDDDEFYTSQSHSNTINVFNRESSSYYNDMTNEYSTDKDDLTKPYKTENTINESSEEPELNMEDNVKQKSFEAIDMDMTDQIVSKQSENIELLNLKTNTLQKSLIETDMEKVISGQNVTVNRTINNDIGELELNGEVNIKQELFEATDTSISNNINNSQEYINLDFNCGNIKKEPQLTTKEDSINSDVVGKISLRESINMSINDSLKLFEKFELEAKNDITPKDSTKTPKKNGDLQTINIVKNNSVDFDSIKKIFKSACSSTNIDFRSPSIIKDDTPSDYNPSTIRKLLGDVSVNEDSLVHTSVDIFEEVNSPQVHHLKEKLKVIEQNNYDNNTFIKEISLDLDHLKLKKCKGDYFSYDSHTEEKEKAFTTTTMQNMIDNHQQSLESQVNSTANEVNNTVEEFEKICNDISVSRPTEFDLLVSQDSVTAKNLEKEVDVSKMKDNLRSEKSYDDQNNMDKMLEKRNEKASKQKYSTRRLRLRRMKTNIDEERSDKDFIENALKNIDNLKQEFSDITMNVPPPKKIVKDIVSPKKVTDDGEEENIPPCDLTQSCPVVSKMGTRSRRKLYTPRAETLEEGEVGAGADSGEGGRLRIPRPSYHRGRARRKL